LWISNTCWTFSFKLSVLPPGHGHNIKIYVSHDPLFPKMVLIKSIPYPFALKTILHHKINWPCFILFLDNLNESLRPWLSPRKSNITWLPFFFLMGHGVGYLASLILPLQSMIEIFKFWHNLCSEMTSTELLKFILVIKTNMANWAPIFTNLAGKREKLFKNDAFRSRLLHTGYPDPSSTEGSVFHGAIGSKQLLR
jgi:hypothetical protein